MHTALITGANRGIGLEFVRQYVNDGWKVHACCRAPHDAQALRELAIRHSGDVTLHSLDLADFSCIGKLAHELAGKRIDLLINNAGIYPDHDSRGFGNADIAAWELALHVNTMAPLKMAEAFIDHIADSQLKRIVCLTSKMGSMADNGSGGCYLYRSSKAALNAVAKSLAIDLAPRGILVGLLHPGWVQTDMGGPNAWITPEQSVSGMRRVIANLTQTQSGRFLTYDGQEVPW
jgi:NAD(P)-dependent dehydrogenase (short-subunit alcohol dehydrogenase family)